MPERIAIVGSADYAHLSQCGWARIQNCVNALPVDATLLIVAASTVGAFAGSIAELRPIYLRVQEYSAFVGPSINSALTYE